jgi:hypothetical protein
MVKRWPLLLVEIMTVTPTTARTWSATSIGQYGRGLYVMAEAAGASIIVTPVTLPSSRRLYVRSLDILKGVV